ncbi:MAG: hypothetical protein AVDCRST_MAG49-459, partial [uncultured Thermomicrobiales bacterium]
CTGTRRRPCPPRPECPVCPVRHGDDGSLLRTCLVELSRPPGWRRRPPGC